jgi:hypothetical protein|tara:strand:+ start:134 stop:457 length:324 start_codon:yes stop_codon:yes gene_type:complete
MIADIDASDLAKDIEDMINRRARKAPKPAPKPEFSSVKEVSRRLFGHDYPQHLARVRAMIREGKIQATKAGSERSAWWVFNSSVDAYLVSMKAISYNTSDPITRDAD